MISGNINPDLINPDAPAEGSWVEIWKGQGERLLPDETDEDSEVTLSVKIANGLPILACLTPGGAYMPEEGEAELEKRGWEVDDGTWYTPPGENCEVAAIEELGETISEPPYLITWEEFSKWRWISREDQEFDHKDPESEVNSWSFEQWAWDADVIDSSNNHSREAFEVLVGVETVKQIKAELDARGIQYECRQLTLEDVKDGGYQVGSDFGAIARYTGFHWTWEEL